MDSQIRHIGVVDAVNGQIVTVRILQKSACSGCQASGICRASESKEKLVEVNCPDSTRFLIGQEVTVSGTERLAVKAVILAFGMPLLIMLVALIAVVALTGSEKTAAAAAFLVLVPYYLVLFLLRDRIKKEFVFTIIA